MSLRGMVPLLLAVALSWTTRGVALAQEANPDEAPRTWVLPLEEGQSSVIYEGFTRPYVDGNPVPAGERPQAVAEYRGGVWQRPAPGAPASWLFSGALQAAPAVVSAGREVATMTLRLGAEGLTVTFPEASTSLVDTEGRVVDAYPILEITAAGWLTLPGESRPTAFVHMAEPGASCCAATMLARRGDHGPWTWRARSWGHYANLPHFDDLDRDGAVEWITRDERFSRTPPGSFGPLGIWQLGPSGFSTVTWRFPGEVEADRRWLASVEAPDDALASWVAETRLLGRPVPVREVRARARRIGAGEGSNQTLNGWLRSVDVRAARYVADHTPRQRRGVRIARDAVR